ncbi:MAG: xanthine dehydrogenase family protein subunit M [candidate division Zixibacteria bacterium]|nr:xanthine dehydrogenase family protein subunit M [candidate division Zixibacteria bacterium]
MLGRTEVYSSSNLTEALEILASKKPVVIAGGTDILVQIKGRVIPIPKNILDIDSIKSLRFIKKKRNKIVIGPLVTYEDILNSELLREFTPHLFQAAYEVGAPQIRSRGTIGGNIVNASPAGDSIPPLYTLNTDLTLKSVKGERKVNISKFFKGPRKTSLRKNELLTEIEFEIPKGKTFSFFKRLGTRKALAIAKVSVAGQLLIADGLIKSASIALGSVGPTVIYSPSSEKALVGNEMNDSIIRIAVKKVMEDCTPIDDIRSEAEYRKAMVGVLLENGLNEILSKLNG